MKIPSSVSRFIDTRFPTVAIWMRFLKHRLEGNPELQVARAHIRRDTAALDIGARRGIYTWMMAGSVGSGGRVIAFEPNPVNAKSLRRIFRDRPNVTIEEVALSDEEGAGTLAVPVEGGIAQDSLGHVGNRPGEGACESFEIRLAKLDSMLADLPMDISFMKIDVEGHELSVLRGARETLVKHQPVLLVEIEQRHAAEPIATRFDLLASLGYRAFFIAVDNRLRPLAEFDLETQQSAPCRAELRFVNMFLFLPADQRPPVD